MSQTALALSGLEESYEATLRLQVRRVVVGAFNVIEKFIREGLRIDVDTSLPAARVIRGLNELLEVRGAPLSIRLDNGPEFVALAQWAQSRRIALNHIQPGNPTQNGYVEGFKKTYRTEVLDCYVFDSLQEVKDMTTDWLHRYNHQRRHESLC